jgi:hypothetical protein
VREAALYAVLGTVLDRGSVLVVVVASRLMMTFGDVVWAGVGELLYRLHRPRLARTDDAVTRTTTTTTTTNTLPRS